MNRGTARPAGSCLSFPFRSAAGAGLLPCFFLKREPLRGYFQVLVGMGEVAGLKLLAEALLAASVHVMEHSIGNKAAAVASRGYPIEHGQSLFRQHDIDAFTHARLVTDLLAAYT